VAEGDEEIAYREGGALVLLVPLTTKNLLRAVLRVATQRCRRGRS
jgi:hypothetical protein